VFGKNVPSIIFENTKHDRKRENNGLHNLQHHKFHSPLNVRAGTLRMKQGGQTMDIMETRNAINIRDRPL
jgi:hypothetical protein